MDKALLKYHMDKNHVSVQQLCDFIGISKAAFYRKVNGISEFTRAEIEKICECLHLDSPVDIFFPSKVS